MLKVEGKVALHAMRAYGGVEVEVKGHTDTNCSVLHITFLLFGFILTLHVSTNVDFYLAYSTNPQNRGKMFLFVRSLKYDNMCVCVCILVQQNCDTFRLMSHIVNMMS